MEENLNKSLYKLLIGMLKCIPMLLSICYAANTFLYYIDIDNTILSHIAGISLLPWLFLYLAATVFRFCAYHKMFLWYILITDILNIIDYYIGIPVSDANIIALHLVLTYVCLFVILKLYVKSHKKITTKDS